LNRPAVDPRVELRRRKRGAKRFMPRDHLLQTVLKQIQIERALEAYGTCDIQRGITRINLVQKPQPLLRRRKKRLRRTFSNRGTSIIPVASRYHSSGLVCANYFRSLARIALNSLSLSLALGKSDGAYGRAEVSSSVSNARSSARHV